MVDDWGESATGFGFGGELTLAYRFIGGLSAQLGYRLDAFTTTYEGDGCQYGSACQVVTGASASDYFHHLGLQAVYSIR